MAQLANLSASIRRLDKRIVAWCRANDAARRLATIPGIGPITASALAATITDPTIVQIRPTSCGVGLGLVPRAAHLRREARRNLAGLTKMGDQYLRKLRDRGYDRGDPIGAAHQGASVRLGQRAARAPPGASGLGCARQQGGADRLGDPHARRNLPGTSDGGQHDKAHHSLADRKPLARYGAVEGALARGLLHRVNQLTTDVTLPTAGGAMT